MRRSIAAMTTLALACLASAQTLAQNAYITNHGSTTVSVIDTATNTVTATITGLSSPFGVAVTPDGSKVYVANTSSGAVSVIDTATNAVTATITVGRAHALTEAGAFDFRSRLARGRAHGLTEAGAFDFRSRLARGRAHA